MLKRLLSQLIGTPLVILVCILGMCFLFNKQLSILSELESAKRSLSNLERTLLLDKLSVELNSEMTIRYIDQTYDRKTLNDNKRSEAIEEYVTERKVDNPLVIDNLYSRMLEQYKRASGTKTEQADTNQSKAEL